MGQGTDRAPSEGPSHTQPAGSDGSKEEGQGRKQARGGRNRKLPKGMAQGETSGESPLGKRGRQPHPHATRHPLLRPFELDIDITQADELRGALPLFLGLMCPPGKTPCFITLSCAICVCTNVTQFRGEVLINQY